MGKVMSLGALSKRVNKLLDDTRQKATRCGVLYKDFSYFKSTPDVSIAPSGPGFLLVPKPVPEKEWLKYAQQHFEKIKREFYENYGSH